MTEKIIMTELAFIFFSKKNSVI